LAAEKKDVIIVGGGHAGLSASYFLKKAGINHVVLEKGKIAQSWHTQRWDSFHLVLPNWTLRLPGFNYSGTQPDGFLDLKSTIQYIEDFSASFDPPVVSGVEVLRLEEKSTGFFLSTTAGDFQSRAVIVATGPFQMPVIPEFGSKIPKTIQQMHSSNYRNPMHLLEGGVVVVGTGQSGAQIAEELQASGRKVFLSVSRCGARPRSYRGKDCVWWMNQQGFYDRTSESLSTGQSKLACNVPLTGYDGGRDIDLREFAQRGINLIGKITGIDAGKLEIAQNLRESLDYADSEWQRFLRESDAFAESSRLQLPLDPRAHMRSQSPPPPEITELNLEREGITNVIWATGFKLSFNWINLPIFDKTGYPVQARGVTKCPGLYFLGLPWMHKRKSAIFLGASEDAEYVASDTLKYLKNT
jgi:putative flavoprotein involved in K+ transport